jgi:hypothetical protein
MGGQSASCLAQQPSGPATLENLLDGPDRPPLKPTAKDADRLFPPVVPDETAVKEARDLIKQVYEDDYKAAAKNPEPLIQKLLAAAWQTKDPVRRYAFLISAEEAAVTGGDYGRTMELIEIREGEFAIDGLQSRIDRLTEFLTPKTKTDPEILARLYEHAIETAERGVKQDALEQAKAAAEMAASIAKSLFMTGKAKKNDGVADDGEAKQTQARALVKDIERRAELFAEYQKALETIKAKEDPAANGVIGRYLCFVAGDWKKGLQFLAKGDQKDVAEVAAEELKVFADGKPDDKEVFSLAGKWWAAADAKDVPDSLRTAVRSHAGGLYESIWERLDDPLDRAMASKRRTAQALPNVSPNSPAERGGLQSRVYLCDLQIVDPVTAWGGIGVKGDLGHVSNGHSRVTVGGRNFTRSVSMHAGTGKQVGASFDVPDGVKRLVAKVAINDSAALNSRGGPHSPIHFKVLDSDGKVLWHTKRPIGRVGVTEDCKVAVGVEKRVRLVVEPVGSGDWGHSVWLDPYFE